jgi:ribonuclease HII
MPNQRPLQDIEAKALLEDSASKSLELAKRLLKDDSRAGARNLIVKFEKRVLAEEKERRRLETLGFYERQAMAKGFQLIAGVDEAGRGPLAGPVVAAAVIFPAHGILKGLDDSKKLTPAKREELFGQVRQLAVSVGVGQASVREIDELNIYRAAQLAMERAIGGLKPQPDYLLTDAMPLPKLSVIPQKPLIHGDALSASIAAASIIAKVTRDRLMVDLHEKYPAYGFAGHKGYGTEEHMKAIEEKGPCPEHRLTFGPIMESLSKKASGGPFQYWSEKLNLAKSLVELQQVGAQIKRIALPHLSEKELESLRELFRGKRTSWESKKP